eukprot:4988224-Prymnesium_polylepis.1
MVDVLQNLLLYSGVALVLSSDAETAGVARSFEDAAYSAGLAIITSVSFRKNASNFESQHRGLLQSRARVIVLLADAADGSRFVQAALARGVGGEGFLWLLDDPSFSRLEYWVRDLQLRSRALIGCFALALSNGESTATEHDAYTARRQEFLRQTLALNGSCSLQKDDEGTAY